MPIRIPSAFGALPFNKQDSIDAFALHDDFITAVAVADLVDANGAMVQSELHWLGSEIAGAAVSNVTLTTSVADHPGILALNVGATSPADGDAAALQLGGLVDDNQDMFILDDHGIYLAAVLRIPDVDAQIVEFGLAGQAPAVPNSSAADIVSWVWDPEDAVNVGDELWIAQVNGAGTDVEDATSLAYVQGDWVLLEIAADDTSATFRITTEDGSDTINIADPTMPVVGLRPVFSVENVGAAEEILEIDAFQLRYFRRNTPYGTSGYLGA